jgi:hypothetical protein
VVLYRAEEAASITTMKSTKPVLPLDKICLPFKVTFPETIEGGVNNDTFVFRKNEEVFLTYPQYEALCFSSYKKYL